MRKTVAKRILVSLITLVMVSVCVLPMVIKNANVAGAAENVAGSDEEYKDNLKLRKYISDELPDENGYYTLNFSAQTKNLQTVEGEEQNIVLVIDSSLSMACDIRSDVESKNMGYTYENTRWNIMYNSIDAFLQKFFEANANSKVSLVSYNKDADVKVTESSKKSDVLDALKEIYSKDMFEESRKESESYEYVEVSTTTDKKGKTIVIGKTEFTTIDSGYAKEFFLADNADSLNESVNKITTTITPVIFEDASVTDTLDKHFKLAEGQENVTDNGDGTFTYIPAAGYTGTDSFDYDVVLVVDGNEYTAHAKVTINVNPAKTPETPSESELPSQPENPSQPEVPSQPEIPSESVTVPASGEVAADEEVVVPEVAADESTVTTGDSSHVMLYVIIMIVAAGIAAATIIVRHKKGTK